METFFLLGLSFFFLSSLSTNHASKSNACRVFSPCCSSFLFFPQRQQRQHCFAHIVFIMIFVSFRILKHQKNFQIKKLHPPFFRCLPPPPPCPCSLGFYKDTFTGGFVLDFFFISVCVKLQGGETTTRKGTTRKKMERKRGEGSRFAVDARCLHSLLSSCEKRRKNSSGFSPSQRKMLASTAPLRASTSSMPRAAARPSGLTVEAKWKVR